MVRQIYDTAFLFAITANSLFVILQIIFAYVSNSTSLLADAFHNLAMFLGLIVSWIGTFLLRRKPTAKTTYGLKKISILSSLSNGLLLVFTCGIIATEAIYKLFHPTPIHATAVIIVASIGIIVKWCYCIIIYKGYRGS